MKTTKLLSVIIASMILLTACGTAKNDPKAQTNDAVINDVVSLASRGDHSAAYSLLLTVADKFTDDELIEKAEKLIEAKSFDAAYVILSVSDNSEAKSMLAKFVPLPIKEMQHSTLYFHYYNERGQIIRTTTASTSDPDKYVDSALYAYDEDGILVGELHAFDEDGYIKYYYYNGLVSKKTQYGNDTHIETSYEYNSSGDTTKITTKYLNIPRDKVFIQEYLYNEKGEYAKIVESSYYKPGRFEDEVYENYTTDVKTVIYEYDSNGNLIKETKAYREYITDSEWNIKKETFASDDLSTYKYDENNNLIEKYVSAFDTTYSYEYDSAGRMIYSKSVNAGGTYETKYSYNDAGLLLTDHHIRDGKDVQTLEYFYDCYGNLLKATNTLYRNNTTETISQTTYSYFYSE